MNAPLRVLASFILATLVLGSQAQDEPLKLVENGRSEWHIEPLGDQTSVAFAREIQAFIRDQTGVELPIGLDSKKHAIIIGPARAVEPRIIGPHASFAIGVVRGEPIYFQNDRQLFFVGHELSDFRHQLLQFKMNLLEVEMLAPGQWSRSTDRNLSLRSGRADPLPPFDFRMVFYGPATDSAYAAEHRIRQVIKTRDSEDPDWGLWVHTMHRFVPPAQFEAHPEYFAERNGTRVPDQLCLSNPEVLRITVDSLRAMMARNSGSKPGVTGSRYWSVSQMDNYNHCQCAQCHRTDSIDGSPSGSILRFANAVADSFPDKVISTLAYQYSRSAPKVTTPRPNVNIMLCSIEEDRSRPIASRDQPGSFTADLRDWSALTHNIIVWDYVINFSHLVMPFPNWKVLAPNLQLFRDAGVPMMFEQGLSSPGGEMPEFRTYLLAKLLWNPDLNVDSLRWHFMDTFYGEAGVYIDKYTRLLEQELDKSGKALTLYEHPSAHKDGYLSPENLAKYKMLFNSAEASTWDEDTIYQWRVEDARLGIMYAELEIARAMPHAPNGLFEKDSLGNWHAKPYYVDLLDEFVYQLERHGHRLLHETRITPEEYWSEFLDYFDHGFTDHLGLRSKISFATAPDLRYTGGRSDALIDGYRAGMNYQFGWQGWYGKDMVATIDLGRSVQIDTLSFSFLQDQQSWIFLPERVSIEWSETGTDFNLFDDHTVAEAAEKGTLSIFTDTFYPKWSSALTARYLRITAKNLGPLPTWHGSKGECWLFCDEIVVK